MKIRNDGDEAVAFTPTFGFPDLYLVIEILDQQDRPIPHPAQANLELFSDPPYICLRPNQEKTHRVDLFQWHYVIGGTVQTDTAAAPGPYAFALPDGRYKARLKYESPGAVRHRLCRTSASTNESDWVSFDVSRSPQRLR